MQPNKTNRLGLVGPLGVGKDFVASKLGFKTIGFADPLYALGSFLYPEVDCSDKTQPGVRGLLQQLGQYGRGTVSDRYPLTAERASIVSEIRNYAPRCDSLRKFGVDWSRFGLDPDLWVDALLSRAAECPPEEKLCVTNLRFSNELGALRRAGFLVCGVVCPRSVLSERQGNRATATDKEDISEQLGNQVFDAFFNPDLPCQVDGYIWNYHEPAAALTTLHHPTYDL